MKSLKNHFVFYKYIEFFFTLEKETQMPSQSHCPPQAQGTAERECTVCRWRDPTATATVTATAGEGGKDRQGTCSGPKGTPPHLQQEDKDWANLTYTSD